MTVLLLVAGCAGQERASVERPALRPDELPQFTYGTNEGKFVCGDHVLVEKIKGTTREHYDAYLDTLHDLGFTDYATNTIDNNVFTTLINDVTAVSYYYTEATGVTRVVTQPRGALFPRAEDNIYTDKGMDTLLTGLKGTRLNKNMMGFIIRLCDGSFVIIDGGWPDDESAKTDTGNLMKILREQSPPGTEKPVIAAWFFTHCHDDHIGLFNYFAPEYHDQVQIESFYYNFPTREQIARCSSSYMLDDKKDKYDQFLYCMEEYYADVPKITFHTGDKFHIRNAEFEVLAAPEDLIPNTVAEIGMNESSVIVRMNAEGQSVLWTGDADMIGSLTALKVFGSYLKSDILQLAHHGENCAPDFYKAIDPTYALLPTYPGRYEDVILMPATKWLIGSPNLRQLINTADGTYTITLPYDPADGTFDRLPKEAEGS